MTLAEALAGELAALALSGKTATYAELARRLAIPGPGSIATLTRALEDLMAEDARAGRPFRAALCAGRLSGGLPARGFFLAAAALGRYAGDPEGAEAVEFAAEERRRLQAAAQSVNQLTNW